MIFNLEAILPSAKAEYCLPMTSPSSFRIYAIKGRNAPSSTIGTYFPAVEATLPSANAEKRCASWSGLFFQ